jgi:hypothetical protein
MDKLWDVFVEAMRVFFMPLVCAYFSLSANLFFNVSAKDAEGLEWVGNELLSPVQYLLAGSEAICQPDGSIAFVQKFDYKSGFWIKTAVSLFALPPSAILGSVVKGLGFLSPATRKRHAAMRAAKGSTAICCQREKYRQMGLQIEQDVEALASLNLPRRPGDEQVLQQEKRALADITALLNQAKIPWWVDCGTCLGAYRYGGAIPWDQDIDLAVLLDDFDNVCHALNQLDPQKYLVQNWSTRDHPNSYIKVYIRESGTMIDIYHFAIRPEKRELHYIFSLENTLFFPDWFKERERVFKTPVSFDTVFPLRKAAFDGLEVFVPNDTKKYLQRCYGENLDPVKVYDPKTGQYEKDLSHPYWQKAYRH